MITFDPDKIKQDYRSTYVGFISDDPSLYNQINQYVANITTSLYTTNITSSAIPTCATHLVKWTFTQFEKAIPTLTKCRFSGYSYSFSQAHIDDPSVIRNYDKINSTPRANTHEIEVYLIKKGMGFFDKISERHPEEHLRPIETLLTEDKFHRISAYKGPNGLICIYTNKMSTSFWLKLIGLLPALYPDYQALLEIPETKAILEALFELNGDKILPIITQSLNDTAAIINKQRIEKFIAIAQDMAKKNENDHENKITEIRRQIDTYLAETTKLMKREEELLYILTGIRANPKNSNIFEELKTVLLKNKNIQFEADMGNSYVLATISTPIMNYVKKDVEMYFKHKDRETYLNNPDWFATMIKLIFLEEKYRLLTSSTIKINWDGRITGQPNHDDLYGNTHITKANCFSSTKNVCQNAITKNDWITVFNALTSACATIVFTDSTIIRCLRDELKGTYHTANILQEVETGKILSPADLKKMILDKTVTCDI